MLCSSIATQVPANDDGEPVSARVAAAEAVRELQAAEILFHDGDRRRSVWRVTEGSLCHFIRWEDGRHEVIEFVFAGELIGFGHLDRYVSSVRAMTPTTLVEVDDAAFEGELARDPRLAMRFAASGDREFEVLRRKALSATSNDPLPRAAAFLSAVAQISAGEDRTGGFIPDDAVNEWSAEHIGLSVTALKGIVEGLERQGLMKPVAGGHVVVDAKALDALAAA